MAKELIDLHIHSNCSDGVLSPKQIIDKAVENGVKTISITDHDTVSSYTSDLFQYAEKKKINLVPGVEISCKLNKIGIHILGYNFDLNNKELLKCLDSLRNARHNYLVDVSNALNKVGYVVNVSKLDLIEAVTKAHIAIDVIENELNKKLLLKEFGHIPSKGEFIETIMNEGCKAYVKKESVSPKEASEYIKKAGGKVVIAHPVAYRYEDNLNEEDIERLIEDINPFGLEANYIYVDKENRVIDECEIWNKIAKKHNLVSTIGSDYHNSDSIRPEIGLVNTSAKLGEKEMKTIIDMLNNHYKKY